MRIRVADRDQHVPDESIASGALDRRSGEELAERRVIELGECRQPRSGQLFARQKVGFPGGPGEFVPRADRKAIVAAVNAIADSRA